MRPSPGTCTSDPAEDVANDWKKSTVGYDRLFRLKPLMLLLLLACQAFYHPYQNLSIDKRIVGTKARISLKQYIKGKPTKWSFLCWLTPGMATPATSRLPG